jgi:hypothetical protein
MTPKTVEYYDWFEDLEPIVLENLNEILVSKGIEPVKNLHGGAFKDGKWVSVLESKDYRNYWHAYLDLWGERVRNDSYDEAYYNWCDDDEEWSYCYEQAEKFGDVKGSGYNHSDPKWACDLVDAIRKMCRDHNLYEGILIKWSW